jgi:membrane protein implicated in regulation of membrane protease activity
MWSAIDVNIQTVWELLPAVTVALQFGTALIGFIVAVTVLVRRVRRRSRRHR